MLMISHLEEEDERDPLVVSVLDDFTFALDPGLNTLVGVFVAFAGSIAAWKQKLFLKSTIAVLPKQSF